MSNRHFKKFIYSLCVVFLFGLMTQQALGKTKDESVINGLTAHAATMSINAPPTNANNTKAIPEKAVAKNKPANIPTEFQALLSAIFIFMGAGVFFISSLVSGHNIFREFSPPVATLISSIVGFILFALSPISFVILSPDIFITPNASELYPKIHREIFYICWAFLFAAIGFGILFGSLKAINARTLFLKWLRRKLRIRYSVISYGYCWDDFLQSIKPRGKITVRGHSGEAFTGQLKLFSIRDEPKQIVLTTEDNTHHLLDSTDIAHIEALSKSFKTHFDSITHQSEAFYLGLSAFGLILISFSSASIHLYLRNNAPLNHYPPWLAFIYTQLSIACIIAAMIMMVTSVLVSYQDFSRPASYFVLCLAVPTIALFECIPIFLLIYMEVQVFFEELTTILSDKPLTIPNDINITPSQPYVNMGLIIFCLAVVIYRYYFGRKIDNILIKGAIGKEPTIAQKMALKKMCELLCDEVDTNQITTTISTATLMTSEFGKMTKEDIDVYKNLCSAINDLIRDKKFLHGEEFNLIGRLLSKLQQNENKVYLRLENEVATTTARQLFIYMDT